MGETRPLGPPQAVGSFLAGSYYYGMGSTQVFPRLKEWGDVDNSLCTVEFAGGHNATYMCTRTYVHCPHSATKIIGTKGKISINRHPRKMNVEISDINGYERMLVRTILSY